MTLPLAEQLINRELGILEFQRRVLEEAKDAAVPLLERVRFLSILGSNMDEFFMIRMAGLKQQVAAGGLRPQWQPPRLEERHAQPGPAPTDPARQ